MLSSAGQPGGGLHAKNLPLGLPELASPTLLSGIRQRWTLDDIPWESIDRQAAAADELLFYLVVGASFVESATDVCSSKLIDCYAGDDQIVAWLGQRWEPEELQHGRALRRYVECVWPELDWWTRYQHFHAEFSCRFGDARLEASLCLEAAARCMMEAGTAAHYAALGTISPEPVLTTLATLIREDELRHYKYFYRYFQSYLLRERRSRLSILRVIPRRLRLTGFGDGGLALKHAYLARHPGLSFDRGAYRAIQARLRRRMAPHLPLEASARMALKPLGIDPRIQGPLVPALVYLCRKMLSGETALASPG
jgi:hypothetical protein